MSLIISSPLSLESIGKFISFSPELSLNFNRNDLPSGLNFRIEEGEVVSTKSISTKSLVRM